VEREAAARYRTGDTPVGSSGSMHGYASASGQILPAAQGGGQGGVQSISVP
jgi:hypothetical protein